MKSHLFAMFLKFHDKSPTLPINTCVTLYALPILTLELSIYIIFA